MHFIFDFDGTLIDSFRDVIDKFNLLAQTYHFREVRAEETPMMRDLSSRELIKFLKIPLYKIPKVILHARRLMKENLLEVPYFPGLPEVLGALHAKQVDMGIVTSNSRENVRLWLEHHGLLNYFQFVREESTYFGKRKLLKKILREYGIEKSQAFYVGDETRDIEAAKHCGMQSVAVSWGFNSADALAKLDPAHLINEPHELLDIAQSLGRMNL